MAIGRRMIGRNNLAPGMGGSSSSLLLSILPGGPTTAQIANPAGLQDVRGNAVTCVRASTKYCRKSTTFDTANLSTDPEGQAPATWFGANGGLTANSAIAPDGTTTALTFADTVANAGHFRGPPTSSAVLVTTSPWTFSFYAKAGTSNFVNGIAGNTTGGVVFNLTTGAVVFASGGYSGSTTSVGNGWWRCVIAMPNTGAADTAYVVANAPGTAASFPSYVGIGDTVYIWGLKSENGSSATAYVSPMLIPLAANIPSVEPEGLLVEGASTNLAKQSADLSNASWTKTGATVTAAVGIAPDGLLTANRVQLTAAARNSSQVSQTVVSTWTGTTNTVSAWVRTTSGTAAFSLRMSYVAVADYFSADFLATTQWQRFTFTQTFPANASTTATCGVTVASALAASDIQVWGMQFEQGMSFASSYIPTVAATASRAADVCSVANPLTAAFPFYMGVTAQPANSAAWGGSGGQQIPLSLGTGTGGVGNTAKFDIQGATLFWVDNDAGAGFGGLAGAHGFTAGSSHRFIGGKTGGVGYYFTVDGVAFGSSTGAGTGLATQPATIYLGTSTGGAAPWGWLKDIRVGKTANSVA